MTYIGKRYIGVAWESEMRHHERTVAQLRIKMEKLTKELAWELQQHHSRLQELQSLDMPLGKESPFEKVHLKIEPSKEGSPYNGKKKKPYRNAFVVSHTDPQELAS